MSGSDEHVASPAEAAELAEARGTDPNTLGKIDWLKQKWASNRYGAGPRPSEEANMMHSVLFLPAQVIHTAVLADNLPYFKAHYKYDPEFVELFLQEACLGGSPNIAEYLLNEVLKSDYKKRPDLLPPIGASMDTNWAKRVARVLAREKQPLPKDIYRLAHGAIVGEIVAIFKDVQPAV